MQQTEPLTGTGLIARLTDQRDLYLKLKALSDQQSGLIRSGETEQLLSVLSRRQELVDALARVNGSLEPYKQQWDTISQSLTDEQRGQVNELLAGVEALLAGIVQQDDRDRRELEQAKQQVSGQLQQAHTAGQAVSAYRNAAGGQS